MNAQLARWHEQLAAGAERVGWKIALNVPAVQERLGLTSPVIGYLTSATLLEPGMPHSLIGGTKIAIEPEVAVELGRHVLPGADPELARAAIASVSPAIEVVDIDMPFEDLGAILEANVFHRGVAFGERQTTQESGVVEEAHVRVARNGREEAAGSRAVGADVVDAVRLVADLLGRFGERLEAGDRIIAGSLTEPVWVEPGDQVTAEIRPLGRLSVSFTK